MFYTIIKWVGIISCFFLAAIFTLLMVRGEKGTDETIDRAIRSVKGRVGGLRARFGRAYAAFKNPQQQ